MSSASSLTWREKTLTLLTLHCEHGGFLLVNIRAYYVLVWRPFWAIHNTCIKELYQADLDMMEKNEHNAVMSSISYLINISPPNKLHKSQLWKD